MESVRPHQHIVACLKLEGEVGIERRSVSFNHAADGSQAGQQGPVNGAKDLDKAGTRYGELIEFQRQRGLRRHFCCIIRRLRGDLSQAAIPGWLC